MNELRNGFLVTQRSPEIHLHYVETNNRPHNPLVIFLHGFPECWYSWREYLQVVAKEGYHGVALDLRGYNESSKPEEGEAYRMEHLVADVRAVIRHFGNKTTFVVGHDWGGLITWELARQSPELLTGIVVMNAPYVQLPEFPELAMGISNFKNIEKIFYQQGHYLKFLTHNDVEVYKEALSDPRTLSAAVNYYQANARDWTKLPEKEIEVPALLIWGEEDIALDKDQTEGMEEFFPKGLTKRFYPHTSHWVHLEHPREVQNEILYFFSLNRLHSHKGLSNQSDFPNT